MEIFVGQLIAMGIIFRSQDLKDFGWKDLLWFILGTLSGWVLVGWVICDYMLEREKEKVK